MDTSRFFSEFLPKILWSVTYGTPFLEISSRISETSSGILSGIPSELHLGISLMFSSGFYVSDISSDSSRNFIIGSFRDSSMDFPGISTEFLFRIIRIFFRDLSWHSSRVLSRISFLENIFLKFCWIFFLGWLHWLLLGYFPKISRIPSGISLTVSFRNRICKSSTFLPGFSSRIPSLVFFTDYSQVYF